MKALAVLPYLSHRLAQESLASLTDPRISVSACDNTDLNRGVTLPWHDAAQWVIDGAADWLVVWSTAIVLGPTGGTDFADALETAECYPYEGYTHMPRIVSGIGCGWHLTGIHRDVLRHVGNFDTGAFFAYYEDSDWIYRHTLSGLGDLWKDGNIQVPVDLDVNRGDAHSINRGLVKPDLAASQAAYVRKWGGLQRRERYARPYNDFGLDWRYTGAPTR